MKLCFFYYTIQILYLNFLSSHKYVIQNNLYPIHEKKESLKSQDNDGLLYKSIASANYKGAFTTFNQPQNYMIEEIYFEIYLLKQNILEFKIKDAKNKRFEVKDAIPDFYLNYENFDITESFSEFNWTIISQPFSFYIQRRETNETIFNTTGFDLIFSDLYLELSSYLPTNHIFGFGERNQFDFQVPNGIYTLFGKDKLADIEDGKPPGHNVYGFHPMHLMREKSGKFHVVYFETTLPLDVEINTNKITYKTIGGIFSFKIFLGNDYPITAINLYQDYIQGFYIPPFWSLGFHQSRWGYLDLKALQTVYFQYMNRSIPFDVIWSDLDYMDDRQIFSIDEKRYNSTEFNQFLNRTKIKYVPLVDPGIGIKKSNMAMVTGNYLISSINYFINKSFNRKTFIRLSLARTNSICRLFSSQRF